jgi:WD40 repeat protein
LQAHAQEPNTKQRRVALVIGNQNYTSLAPLKNAALDAEAVARLLRDNGFDVLLHLNVNRDAFEEALAEFNSKTEGARAALFYYSGHGMEVIDKNDRFNVLAPTDARIDCETRRAAKFVRVDEVLRSTKGVGNQVLFFDACREIAFQNCPIQRDGGTASSGYGFRAFVPEVSQGEAALLVYSTGQKSLARDGEPGKHSPFARVLLDHLRSNKHTHFLPLMNKVVVDVGQQTNFRQVPSVVIEGGIPQVCLSGFSCTDERDEDATSRMARSRTLAQLSENHRNLDQHTVAVLLALEGLSADIVRLWPSGEIAKQDYSQPAKHLFEWAIGGPHQQDVDRSLPTLLYKAASEHRERQVIGFAPEIGELIALSADGSNALYVSNTGMSSIVDLATNLVKVTIPFSAPSMGLFTIDGGYNAISGLAKFSRDGRFLFTFTAGRSGQLWDAYTGAPIGILSTNEKISAAMFGAGNRSVITVGESGIVEIWDVKTQQRLRTFKAPRKGGNTIALSRDDKTLATLGDSAIIYVLDARDGSIITQLSGHEWSVNGLDFHPN